MTAPSPQAPRVKRRLAVILASDVAGYSRLVAADEEDTVRRFRAITRQFQDLVAGHDGRVFNMAGDAILAEFDSAVDAVRCALDVQDAVAAAGLGLPPERRIQLRIGIALGDVIVTAEGDLLGDGVNIAARLESVAAPGGICISVEVLGHVRSKLDVGFVDLGVRRLKNIPEPVRVFSVAAEPKETIVDGRLKPEFALRSRRLRRGVAMALGAATLLGIVGSALLVARPAILATVLTSAASQDPVERLAAAIDFKDVGANIDAVIALAKFAAAHPEQLNPAIAKLKAVLAHHPVRAFDETSRSIKRSAVTALVRLRRGDLHADLADGSLAGKDLVGLDLRNTDIRGATFPGAFLILSDFRNADLGGADLTSAILRGSRFDGARLVGTRLSGADWFNARGFTADQLMAAKPSGLRRCPAEADGSHSEKAFMALASQLYIPFEDWSADEQETSRRIWADYAIPGGLCDTAAS